MWRIVQSMSQKRKHFHINREGQRMPEKNKMRRLIRLLQDDSGSELVEFAYAILILLALFFGIMDFSRAMYCYHYVSYAAQDGARYAIVRGADAGPTICSTSAPYACEASNSDVQNYVKSQVLPLIDPNTMTVNTTWPGTHPGCTKGCAACSPANSQGCLVKVQVTYNFSFLFPLLPRTAGMIFTGTSQKVIQ